MGMSSTAARVRAMQDLALATGLDAAAVAVYGDFVAEYAYRLQVPDAAIPADTPVVRTARRAVPADAQSEMAAWVAANWGWIADAARVLDQLDELVDPFPATLPTALAYRRAAQELAARAGEPCAAVVWAGVVAEARYIRLFGGRRVDDLDAFDVDPVFAAARRQLSNQEEDRLTDVVVSSWDRIDERAEELLMTGVGL